VQRRLRVGAAPRLGIELVKVLGEHLAAELEWRREAARAEVVHHHAHLRTARGNVNVCEGLWRGV
jgi:hypothetical protein